MTSLRNPPKALCIQPQIHTVKIWSLITSLFEHKNPNYAFWWQVTGLPLAILLEKAGYTAEEQYQNLLLYYLAVVPELGPGPDGKGRPKYWKSFMTDHFCPVELSWEWNIYGGRPTIRFSFEPVGLCAGSRIDPFNEFAALRFVRQNHSTIPGCDLQWFNHFSDKLLSFSYLPSIADEELNRQSHQSRIFLALDLEKGGGVKLKVYFMPVFKALKTGRSVMSVISEAIESLPLLSTSLLLSFQQLKRFLETCPEGQHLQPEIVSTDCISPEMSRVKIYMRNYCASFEQVRRTMLLGDESAKNVSPRGMQELKKFWNFIFGQREDSPLGQEEFYHRTSGMLYYFELRSERSTPSVKVYLPVRHYGKSDLCTADRLQDYFRTIGKSSLATKYIEALKAIT
jgi:DMATS type aromatic prenyltransferase